MAQPQGEGARDLAAARAGCPEALGRVLEACRGYLLLIARQGLPADLQAKAGASDLVQETLAEACRAFARFDGSTEEQLLAWLRRLLGNNLVDFTRRYRARAKRRAAAEVPLEGGSSSGEGAGGVAADGSSPSQQAMAHEQEQALWRAMERLPEDYRQVIRLHHEQDLSFEEVGRLMGRSPNAAQKLWRRALGRLTQELENPP
jgi:RNA polymerase sigma-70 factor (ECF subfamily)